MGQGQLFNTAKPKTGHKDARGKKSKGAPATKVRHEHSAGFILFRHMPEGRGGGRRFLLLDYGRHWDYAKGHLENGETAWKAAVRELREETGITQVDRVGKFERDMSYAFFSPKKGHVVKVVTFFLGKTRQEHVKVSDEHTGYAWLPYEEALDRLTFENAREMLKAAAATL